MRKENIKTVILTLLILNCLQLTGQIWFNKKLWPSGYNFFNSVTNNPIVSSVVRNLPFAKNAASGNIYSNAIRPQKIVINGGNAREVYYPGQKQYDEAGGIVRNVITSLLEASSPRSAVISKDEWLDYLKGKSVYVDYGFNMDTSSFANTFGQVASASFPGTGVISDIMITGDAVTKEGIVCLFDAVSNTVTKFWIDYKGDDLINYIKSATLGRQQNKAFYFELYPDAIAGNPNIKRKILLDPHVLLPVKDNEERHELVVSNPLKNDNAVFDRIVDALEYTPSSLRKSVTQEGVASYVENSATIKINPNGLVEYNAVNAEKGILLQSGIVDPYHIASKVAEIANNIYQAAGEEQNLDIYLASDLIDSRGGEYTLNYNYSFMGIPVITQITGSNAISNAICAKVQNGYLKSFKILLRKYGSTEKKTSAIPIISAMDSLAKKYGDSSDKIINDMFECYDSESDNHSVVWGVKVSGDDKIQIVSN